MNKRIANLAPDTEPQAQTEIAATQTSNSTPSRDRRLTGEERSHELERGAFQRLRTIAAALATAAAKSRKEYR